MGDLEVSNKYVNAKMNQANNLGIDAVWIKLPKKIAKENLEIEIKKFQVNYDGVILQLPLPLHLKKETDFFLDLIDSKRDVDGLSSISKKKFYANKSCFFPATPMGIKLLLDFYKINIKNFSIGIIGEGSLVGKPLKHLLSRYNKKIFSYNKNTGIKGSENHDILIVAAGQKKLVKMKHVKPNAIVIDVGINVLSNRKITGDVDYGKVINKVKMISPVPGGVGPMTVISLLKNIVIASKKNQLKEKKNAKK